VLYKFILYSIIILVIEFFGDDDDDLSMLLFSQNLWMWLVLTTLSMETQSWLSL